MPSQPLLLDVLAQHHLIPDAYILEARNNLEKKLARTKEPNRLIERYLTKRRYITEDALAKAYALLFDMPYTQVGRMEIPREVITLLPQSLARRNGVVAFRAEGKSVDIAICKPAELKPGYLGVFEDLSRRRGVKINLFVSTPTQLRQALNWYHWRRAIGQTRLFGRQINPAVMGRIPVEQAASLHLLPYEEIPTLFGSTPVFRVATDMSRTHQLEKILRFIEQKNKLVIALYQTSREDFELALKAYPFVLAEPPQTQATVGEILQKQQVAVEAPKENARPPAPPAAAPPKGILGGILTWFKRLVGLSAPAAGVTNLKAEPAKGSAAELVQVAPAAKPVTPLPTGRYVTGKGGIKILNVRLPEVPKEKKASNLVQEESTDLGKLLSKNVETAKELEDIILSGQIPKIVAALLSYSLALEASDIHIEAEEECERVRFRVDGILQPIVNLPISVHPGVISRIKILSSLKIDETRLPQDGRFGVDFSGREVDIRVSILPTAFGEKIVMRLLDKEKGVVDIDELGMMGRAKQDIIESISKPYGIVLSTGPTGSGKTTTLYAILGRVSKPGVNVSTLEDPIEFEISGINQSQVKPQIGYTFAAGLRSLMRQDPNIIMVGEIRDLETATNAVHAALTGHLVLSTLHTNDSAGALPRLIAMGVEPFLITSAINAVAAQRLVRKICPHCRRETNLPEGLKQDVEQELEKIPKDNALDQARIPKEIRFYSGAGCSYCRAGYKGRIGIYEVLPMTPAVEKLANVNRPADELMIQAQKEGMITMKQDGYLKALAGITTVEEVLREARMD